MIASETGIAADSFLVESGKVERILGLLCESPLGTGVAITLPNQSECRMTGGVAGVDPCWVNAGRAPTPPAIRTRSFFLSEGAN